jgi:hypothetical protein
MVSTVKVSNITTPDGTGNVTFDRPLSGSGASLTNLPATALTSGITVTGSGEVTMSSQPCFASHNNTNDASQTGDGTEVTVDMDVESFDQGNNFASDTFTAPVTGRYLLSAQVCVQNLASGHTNAKVKVVTSNRTYRKEWNPYDNIAVGSQSYEAMTIIADMDASDTAKINVSVTGGAKTISIAGEATEWINFFSGALLA